MKKSTKKKLEYSLVELRNMFKYIYLKNDVMYATKAKMPLTDDSVIYVFDNYTGNYTNQKFVWFNANELNEA